MDLSKLDVLKQLMVHGQDFSQMFVYFLDHLGDQQEFHRLGEQTTVPLFESALGQAAYAWYKLTVIRMEQRLKRLPEQHFIHGTVRLNDYPLSVIYFEDADVGIIAQCVPAPQQQGNLQFIRFSGRPLRKTRGPSPN
ncbi:MAG: hypothetical protein JWM11_7239 [Planctomycetaceae bacterium]|nr:hypothetical protein [Planctomycetaceae bacterium]